MHPRQVAMGGLLLALSSLTLVETGALATRTPLYVAAGAFLAIAVGSWVADRRRHERPA